MTMLHEIIGVLGECAEITKLNEYRSHKTLYMKIPVKLYDEIRNRIDELMSEYKRNSEIVTLTIDRGKFVDLGIKTVDVERGYIWEVYLYDECVHVFIRLLHLRQEGGEWLALYTDYNPDSAWWSAEEREI